jgi:hypothetical protein
MQWSGYIRRILFSVEVASGLSWLSRLTIRRVGTYLVPVQTRKAEPSYALQQQQPLSQAKKNFTATADHNDADPMTLWLLAFREQKM